MSCAYWILTIYNQTKVDERNPVQAYIGLHCVHLERAHGGVGVYLMAAFGHDAGRHRVQYIDK